jgi:hypothetical protein
MTGRTVVVVVGATVVVVGGTVVVGATVVVVTCVAVTFVGTILFSFTVGAALWCKTAALR